MPAEKTTRKQVLKTGFFKHLQNTDSLMVTQWLIFINFQTDHVFEQTAEKCRIFAPSTNESAQGASQEASITTKGGHNRRQAPVIY